MATRAQSQKALELFETQLSSRPNVVGLGIVPLDEQAGGQQQMAVAVYVDKKVPLQKLKADQVVPQMLEVPGKGGPIHVPTRVIEQGKVELEGFGKE
jgi:hypothetical protein